MKEIKIQNWPSRCAMVDDEDYDRLIKISPVWKVLIPNGVPKSVYIYTNFKAYYLGRFLMKTPKGMEVDHRDRDIFNNQKNNLRNVTASDNMANRIKYKINGSMSSKYKGVTWDKNRNKWSCGVGLNGQRRHLGRFNDEVLAAIAYDDAALLLYGECARTNFPLVGY